MCNTLTNSNATSSQLKFNNHSFVSIHLFFLYFYFDDEGVEKDHGLPGMLSVHLVEKIWILVNFIMREDSFDIRPGHFYW